jgi:serine/threonine protein phosphatase PrpC
VKRAAARESAERAELAWHVYCASARGAVHDAAGLPNQDSTYYLAPSAPGDGSLCAAVADGHGDQRHFRSSRGSQLATSVACAVAMKHAGEMGALKQAAVVQEFAATAIVSEVVGRWNEAVLDDLSHFPLTRPESTAMTEGGSATVPYGSTLLLAAISGTWLVLLQIGDGDILIVSSDGKTTVPVPGDPLLDGRITTSLCSSSAVHLFRSAVVDLEQTDVVTVVLASDGFGNAQSEDDWQPAVGRDVARLLGEFGPQWVGEHMWDWADRCASSDGSGDDASLVFMLRGLRTPEQSEAG